MELSEQQKSVVNAVRHMRSKDFIFITGFAGTGKSLLTQYLKDQLGHEIRVVAPTGVAAQNIGGHTIHAFFGLKPGVDAINPFHLKKIMANVKYLLIDEISMVNSGLFELIVNNVDAYCPDMRYILVGDFKQLPPVEGDFVYTSPLWSRVKTYELTTVFRQRDPLFVDALNRLRDGQIHDPVVKGLYEQCKSDGHIPDESTLLTPYRKVSEEYNTDRLQELNKPIHESKAVLHQGFWKDNKIPQTISYAEGAQVLMLTNKYVPDSDGLEMYWCNGDVGYISEIKDPIRHVMEVVIPARELRITIQPERHILTDSQGKTISEFSQLPFQLGYAITIHKSQGMTLPCVAVDMSGHFELSMTYVALSRCVSADNLYLVF
jgi:ATP-dependent DNA helicase PIF1